MKYLKKIVCATLFMLLTGLGFFGSLWRLEGLAFETEDTEAVIESEKDAYVMNNGTVVLGADTGGRQLVKVRHADWFIELPAGKNGVTESRLTYGGENVYCIEPNLFVTDKPYSEFSGNIEAYLNITKEKAEELALIAYFGTMVPGRAQEDWYAITQSLIWERLGEEIWILTPTAPTKTQLQACEAQILKDVNRYKTLPSFNGQHIVLNRGAQTVLTDSNQVLSDMTVEASDGIVAEKEGNTLTIRADKDGEIILKKTVPPAHKGTTMLYSDKSGGQKVARFKSSADVAAKVSVTVNTDVTYEFLKVDAVTKEALSGALLKLTDGNGGLAGQWVSEPEPHRIMHLKAGESYTLSEASPAKGYVTAEPISFTAGFEGEHRIVMEDDTTKHEFEKVDESGEGITGACLTVTDEEGNVVDSWVSDGKPHRLEKLVAGRTYILTETDPAAGYATAEPVKFTVRDTKDPQKVIMYDKKTNVEILKADITTGAGLAGATLRLTDKDGKLVEEWISESEPHKITKLIAGETYTLSETLPAPGYTTAEAVTFTVKDTGEVQTIKMEDEVTKIDIYKLDADSGEAVEGAVLKVSGPDKACIDEWTTSLEPHRMSRLTSGLTYTLSESSAPDGYEKASDLTFTVEDTADVQKVVFKNKRIKETAEAPEKPPQKADAPKTGDGFKAAYAAAAAILAVFASAAVIFIKRIGKH